MISEGREEQPHWVVRREEVEMTSEVVGKEGWGEVRVAKLGSVWLQNVSQYRVILSDYNLRQFTGEVTILNCSQAMSPQPPAVHRSHERGKACHPH